MVKVKLAVAALALAMAATPFLSAPAPEAEAQQPTCTFSLGFATLRDMIIAAYGDRVGACLENEHYDPFNGDSQQQTVGGLMVWRKADNWTAFTDGATTYLNGPTGLAVRPNAGPLFPWEAPAPAGPPPPTPAPVPPGATATPTPAPTTADTPPTIDLDVSDDEVDQDENFTIRIEAKDDKGIAVIWWWATDTDDDDLEQTHVEECHGITPCTKSWTVSTDETGDVRIHAKARDTAGQESEEVTEVVDVNEKKATPTPTPRP